MRAYDFSPRYLRVMLCIFSKQMTFDNMLTCPDQAWSATFIFEGPL